MLYGSVGAVYRPRFMISSYDWFMSAIIAYTSDARLHVPNELWVLISGKPMRGLPSPPPPPPFSSEYLQLSCFSIPCSEFSLFSFLFFSCMNITLTHLYSSRRTEHYLISDGAVRTFGQTPIHDDGQILIHVNVACLKNSRKGFPSARECFSLESIEDFSCELLNWNGNFVFVYPS